MNRSQVAAIMSDVVLGSLEMGAAFKLQTQAGTGTGFVYSDTRGSFFVTAAHLLKGVKVHDDIRFAHEQDWFSQKLNAIFFHPNGYDVAAFVTEQKVQYPTRTDDDFGLMPGQPVKFVGFPHGLHGEYPSETGFLTPLVRSAHFSGTIMVEGKRLTILDGFNNPGYSGSPVYCCGMDGEPKLMGVVSGYKWEREEHSKVYKKDENGNFVPLDGYIVRPNSGMIYVVGKAEFLQLSETVNQFQPPFEKNLCK